MTELELSERLKKGDNMARKELYERFAGMLLSLCLRYTGNRQEAEDVLHDGFLQVFGAFDKFTFRGNGSLAAWLRRVFTNYALNHIEKERRIVTDEVENCPEPPDDDEPPPSVDTDTLMELIGQLPTGYRTVLNLFLVEGWSHAEIAAKLHIGISTSASQYLRAKKLLKEKIIEYIQTHEA